jgi:hypothetical protein
MSNIQKTLEALQPYVIGIRYLKGIPLVDVVLTEGWTLPEDSKITRAKGDEAMNYHMIFSEAAGIGLDELLAYVDKTIKVNLDREKKHELLKSKVNQLKELFKKTPLTKLERLKFTFGEEDFMTSMSDIDIDIEPEIKNQPSIEEEIEEPIISEVPFTDNTNTTAYVDSDGNPIEMDEEEKELAAEEARAQRNLKILENRKQNSSNIAKKIELPPKRKLAIANEINYDSDCSCDENEACEKCIDRKDF